MKVVREIQRKRYNGKVYIMETIKGYYVSFYYGDTSTNLVYKKLENAIKCAERLAA